MNKQVRTRRAYHLVLQRSGPDKSVDSRVLAPIAVEGLFVLASELFRPLDVELGLTCCDGPSGAILDQRPAQPFRQLRSIEPDLGIDRIATYAGAVIEETEDLDAAATLHWLERQFDFSCDGSDTVPGWSELIVNTIEAKLPDGTVVATDELALHHSGETFRYPLRSDSGRLWAAGPLRYHGDTTPFRIAVTCDSGELQLKARVSWSLWYDAELPGHPVLQRAVRSLEALGWSISEYSAIRL